LLSAACQIGRYDNHEFFTFSRGQVHRLYS
jgi:hypothetical protein